VGIIAGEHADHRSLAAGKPNRGLGADLRRLGLRAGVCRQDYSAVGWRAAGGGPQPSPLRLAPFEVGSLVGSAQVGLAVN
jgi:hypothetical protein